MPEQSEFTTLLKAAAFAAHKHRTQRRKDADGSPYINHPIELARVLAEAGVTDVRVLAAGLLHDTVEDTATTPDEIEREFGSEISNIVAEVTDDKSLSKEERKRLQVVRAHSKSDGAKLVKLADKISNLRDILASPPADWPHERKVAYFDWAREVVSGLRGVNRRLEGTFDEVYSEGKAYFSTHEEGELSIESGGTGAAPLQIKSPHSLREALRDAAGRHYVYVLRQPDGVTRWGGKGTPFYVGIGQDLRLFSHEEEANDLTISSAKVETIRAVWASGGQIIREIDSFHSSEPWDREEELINQIGLQSLGRGPLTNAQGYAPSTKMGQVEVRKYAADHATGDVDEIPARFKLANTRLMPGPIEPRSRTSVFGKIYSVAEEHPGATGAELVRLLQRVDFSGNKSAYTQSGQVCAAWLVGYIEGAYFRKDRQHLQESR